MEVAAEHSEAVSQSTRVGVEEGFLFDWIALHSTHISPGNVENPALVETQFANSGLTVGDGTTVAAGVTTHAVAVQFFVEIAFTNLPIQNFAEGRHRDTY